MAQVAVVGLSAQELPEEGLTQMYQVRGSKLTAHPLHVVNCDCASAQL